MALVVSLSGAYDGNVGQGPSFYRAFFIAALFTWGTIAASVCFSDLHGRGTNTAFLLLPASALEKTASRLLIYTVGLIAYLLLFTTLLSWVLEGINTLWVGERRDFFSPLDGLGWSVAAALSRGAGLVLPRRRMVSQGLVDQDGRSRHRHRDRARRHRRRSRLDRRALAVPQRRLLPVSPVRLAVGCGARRLLLSSATVLLVRSVVARQRGAGEPWNLANRRGIYQQIADQMRDRILAGEWHEGERIPSVRELAVGVGVNPNTVTKSYQALLDREIIENQRGLGYFVAADAKKRIVAQMREGSCADELPKIFRTMRVLGMQLTGSRAVLRAVERRASVMRNSQRAIVGLLGVAVGLIVVVAIWVWVTGERPPELSGRTGDEDV